MDAVLKTECSELKQFRNTFNTRKPIGIIGAALRENSDWNPFRSSQSFSSPFRIIPNQSEKYFISCFMKNGKNSIGKDPIRSALIRGKNSKESEPFRNNPNQSGKHFVSRLMKNGKKSIR